MSPTTTRWNEYLTDLIYSELGKLTRKDTVVSNQKINELVRLGLSISMKCSELLN